MPRYGILLSLWFMWSSLFVGKTVLAQGEPCSFEARHAEIMNDPAYQEQMQLVVSMAQDMMQQAQSTTGSATYTIPVVFHVITDMNSGGGISNAQIEAQLAKLNAEFAGNPNSQTGASMGIQFCFAQIASNGSSDWASFGSDHAGITRHQHPFLSTIVTGGEVPLQALYGFPADEYLNIYVVESIAGGTLGYSDFTGATGVVIEAQVTGNEDDPSCNCSLLPGYELGMVLVHEMGHFFQLLHPWGFISGECQEDDGIADTPVTLGPNFFCPTNVNSCSESPPIPDQVENYMDYTDDQCKNTFTEGQRCVAHSMIAANGFVANLVTPENLVRTGVAGVNGCINLGLVPTIELSNATPCLNDSLEITVFSDPNNVLDAWEVVITNGTFSASASGTNQIGNIQANFTLPDEGSYDITVTMTDLDFTPSTVTTVFTNRVFASLCQPICEGAVWHLSKGAQGTYITTCNFSNGFSLDALLLSNTGTNGSTSVGGGTYTYSDCSGGQTFFTDGKDVRGSNGTHIANGNNVFAVARCIADDTEPARDRQGVIGVPGPNGNVTVFMVTDGYISPGCNGTDHGLSFYTVDANTPEVTTPPPGNSPAVNYTYMDAITAIPHCQGTGTWIIVKGASDNVDINQGPPVNAENQIMAYLFDGTSLSAPVVSSSGPYVSPRNATLITAGYTAVETSPDGRWIIFSAGGKSYIYEFNALTGTCSYKAQIGGTFTAFSASGDLLYAAFGARILQYDFEAFKECCEFPEPAEIEAGSPSLSVLQRGPDGKIYTWPMVRWGAISVINAPDVLIQNGNTSVVGFIRDAYPLPPEVLNRSPFNAGVPNFIEATTSQGLDFYCCVSDCDTVSFRAEGCAAQYSWNLGNGETATGSTVTTGYPGTGTYSVTLTADGGMSIVKEIQLGFPVPPEILPEGNLCVSSFMTYNVNLPGMEYQWSVGQGGTLLSFADLPFAEVEWNDPQAGGTICLTITDPETGCSENLCFEQGPCEPCTGLTITSEVSPECDSDGSIVLNVTGGSGQYIYQWTPAMLPSSGIQQGLTAGTYTVKVTDSQADACSGELEITVPRDSTCIGCDEPLNVLFNLSPDVMCYESDADSTYYFVNLWIGNWGNQTENFYFCSDDFSVSVGELLSPSVSFDNLAQQYELGGFLRVPNANAVPGSEVVISIVLCKEEQEVCTDLRIELPACKQECTLWNIEAQVNQTPLGLMTPPPCGDPSYEFYAMDFSIDITIPALLAGNDFAVGIWSTTGELCSEGLINNQPTMPNAPSTFTIPFSSLYNSYNLKHFCFQVLLRNENTGHYCIEYFCVPLEAPESGEFGMGGYVDLEAKAKEGKGNDETGLDVQGLGKTGQVLVKNIEDGNWHYQVFSITGQFLGNGRLSDEAIQLLRFDHLAPGYYVLKLENSVTKAVETEPFIRW